MKSCKWIAMMALVLCFGMFLTACDCGDDDDDDDSNSSDDDNDTDDDTTGDDTADDDTTVDDTTGDDTTEETCLLDSWEGDYGCDGINDYCVDSTYNADGNMLTQTGDDGCNGPSTNDKCFS